MERKIPFSQIEKAVNEAYEELRNINEGKEDPRVAGENTGKFGIAVSLADGSTIVKGDVDVPFALASLSKIPLSAVLLSQNNPDEILKKSGQCCCCKPQPEKPDVPISCHGLRAISAVAPQNDPEGKWNVILDTLNAMIGSPAVLDDKAYEAQLKLNADADVENKLAAAEYYLYDDAPIAIDAYSKLQSLRVTLRQLAALGATIAADGVNPATGVPAYDGSINQYVVGMMASHGPHKLNKMWLFKVGLPAKSGWGGGFIAILPGVLSICAFSPELNEAGVSVKASRAVASIARRLDISAFASAKVAVDK